MRIIVDETKVVNTNLLEKFVRGVRFMSIMYIARPKGPNYIVD